MDPPRTGEARAPADERPFFTKYHGVAGLDYGRSPVGSGVDRVAR